MQFHPESNVLPKALGLSGRHGEQFQREPEADHTDPEAPGLYLYQDT